MSKYCASASATVPALLKLVSSSSSRSSTDHLPSQGQKRPFGILIADTQDTMNRTTNTTISHGVISVIGRRRSMEDTVTVAPDFVHVITPPPHDGGGGGGNWYDFFAVYDGHGGSGVALRCKERMHQLVAEEIVVEAERTRGSGRGVMEWEKVMERSYNRMDEEVVTSYEEAVEATGGSVKAVGSTALVAVVGKEVVVLANCGDCRAVLYHDGAALPLSHDHKPDRPDERERVEAAGGNVVELDCSRVLGVLSTSRSIGDHYLKPYVISEPEVTVHQRTSSDQFLILASDGLWDVVPNEVACEVVRKCLHGQVSRQVLEGLDGNCSAAAATVLAELALSRRSVDNISVVVVELQRSACTSSA